MNPLKAVVFAAALLTGSLAQAAPDAEAMKQAEKLLSVIGMEQTLTQATVQMVDAQTQQNPALTPFKTVMLEFFTKYMSFESLQPEMVKAYAEGFTTEELIELNAFYASPLGKKAVTQMPAIMAQVAQMGTSRAQANIKDLQASIEAEAQRLKQEQDKQQAQPAQ
ncbi:MAG: DUF2059 domain-containing protein [Haliea sp.]|nr:DUF2059 domain-containing protein [Haliea sp.]